MWKELGNYAQKAWRVSKDTFNILHDLLDDKLNEEFGEVDKSGRTPNGPIPTKLRLSAALRFLLDPPCTT